jgi:hypothetical protein
VLKVCFPRNTNKWIWQKTSQNQENQGKIYKNCYHQRHNCAKLYAVGSSGIAFFSESRVKSISNILGHTRFKDVLEKLATTINLCIGRNSDASGLRNKVNRSSTAPEIPEEIAKSYSTGTVRNELNYLNNTILT